MSDDASGAATPEPAAEHPPAPRFVQPYPGAPPVPVQGGGAPLPPYARPPQAPTRGRPPQGPTQSLPPQGYGAGRPSPLLGIIALCLAAGGVLIALVPFLQLFAAPFLLGGLTCGIIGLAGREHGGKGLSLAAVITSAAAGLVSVLLAVVFLVSAGGWFSGWGGGSDTPDGVVDSPYVVDPPPSAVPDAAPLALAETAFGTDSLDPSMRWYAVVIDNPNAEASFEDVYVLVQAVDDDGVVLDSSSEYLTILPGRTALAGYFLGIGDDSVARLEVELPDPATATVTESGVGGALTVLDVQTLARDDETTVSGTVTSTVSEERSFVGLTVLARDVDGTIVGAEDSYLDVLPPYGTVPFEVTVYGAFPADTVFEVHVLP